LPIPIWKSRASNCFNLSFTVNNLRKPDALSDAFEEALDDVQYGVLPQHYPMVGSSLLKAFEVSLGTAWTPDVQQAWTEAYEVVAQLMLEGADYSPERLMPTVVKSV